MEIQLSILHYVYLIGVLVVLGAMIARKDTVMPCIVFTFALGFAAASQIPDSSFVNWLIGGLQVNYNALIFAGSEFFGIIATIAMMVAMSKQMADMGTDKMMMDPLANAMKTPDVAFFVLGIAMAVVTILIWPSPAVALIGGLLTPIAIRAGLPAIGAAIAMNIFGHGFAFAFDPVIQGAPGVTAGPAGIDSWDIISNGAPIFTVIGIVAVALSYIRLRKDLKVNSARYEAERKVVLAENAQHKQAHGGAKFMLILTPILFVVAIFLMLKYQIRGGDATAMITGTAMVLMTIGVLLQYGLADALEKIVDYVRDGFGFGMKIFAPVVIIGGFFFIGGSGVSSILQGEYQQGLLMDWGWWLAARVPLSKYPVAILMVIIGGITGLDGSGFSGLPLVGSMALSFGQAVNLNVPVLAAIGQSGAQWIGGGTIIPWAVIPVAAMCGVDPGELARRNTIPVLVALLCGTVVSFFLL
ncbi:MAG: citrate transporter [Clostridiales bacterium]